MSLVCLSSENCLWAFLCIIFRRGFLLGRQSCRPIWCSVRRMVWAQTGDRCTLCSNAGSTHTSFSQTQPLDMMLSIHRGIHRGVLTFAASGLDLNNCVMNYFEGTANLQFYTSCTLTTLHCRKMSLLQCCHMKRYNKIFTQMWGVYSLLWDTVHTHTHTSTEDAINTICGCGVMSIQQLVPCLTVLWMALCLCVSQCPCSKWC